MHTFLYLEFCGSEQALVLLQLLPTDKEQTELPALEDDKTLIFVNEAHTLYSVGKANLHDAGD